MLRRLRSLWRALVGRTAFEDDMDAEIRFHLESRAADFVRRGASPFDPRLYAAAALPLAVAIAAALLIPARRATSLEPLRLLKQE
jgi:hypothetical protein